MALFFFEPGQIVKKITFKKGVDKLNKTCYTIIRKRKEVSTLTRFEKITVRSGQKQNPERGK